MEHVFFTQLSVAELRQLFRLELESLLSFYSLAGQNGAKEDNKLLTVKEAAEFLNLAVPTIYSLSSKQAIPHSKRGKRLYFSKPELKEWVQSGKRKTVEEIEREVFISFTNKKKGSSNGK